MSRIQGTMPGYEAQGARSRRTVAPDNRTLLFGDRVTGPRPSSAMPSHVAGAEVEALECRNGIAVDTLRDRVGDMHHLALNIGNEVDEQNKLLDGMGSTFESAGGQLAQTMRDLQRLARSGGAGHLCAMFAFAFTFFFLLYLLVH